MRSLAIWLALAVLAGVSAIVAPRSVLPSSILPVIPFAAFLAITAMGEALVMMVRGIDLSIPAVVTMSSTILLGVSGGHDSGLLPAVVVALALSVAIGLMIGAFVVLIGLNPLVVTLAVATMLGGVTLWYRQGITQEARVPPLLANWGDARFLALNASVWIAIMLVALLTMGLRSTIFGRRFAAVGANPRSATIAGIRVAGYQIAAYATAGLLYGIAGILLSAFIRNPTLDVGAPYLLAPIAAAVLAGTGASGGVGSMIAVAGAALFLTQLGQLLKILGLQTAIQFMIYGAAIAIGMAVAGMRGPALRQ